MSYGYIKILTRESEKLNFIYKIYSCIRIVSEVRFLTLQNKKNEIRKCCDIIYLIVEVTITSQQDFHRNQGTSDVVCEEFAHTIVIESVSKVW